MRPIGSFPVVLVSTVVNELTGLMNTHTTDQRKFVACLMELRLRQQDKKGIAHSLKHS